MSTIIIDPPVGPYHSIEDLSGWVDDLEEMRVRHEDDEDALPAIDRALVEARAWLDRAKRVAAAGS